MTIKIGEVEIRNPRAVTNLADTIALGEHQTRTEAVRLAIAGWKSQATEERKLRRTFAFWLLGAFFVQVFLCNLAFFLIGWKYLTVDEWTARIFISATFAELAAMVFFMVRYLFTRDEQAISSLIKVLYDADSESRPKASK